MTSENHAYAFDALLSQAFRIGRTNNGTTSAPFTLARLAGVADPDSTYTPGAVFLSGVFDSWLERVTYDAREYLDSTPVESRTVREFLESLDVESIARDVSCGRSESIYTLESWRVFTDLALWREDLELVDLEWLTNRHHLSDVAAVLVELVGYRLAETLTGALVDVAAKL
jgi:hypothetical protein